jgi:hypothetical protein
MPRLVTQSTGAGFRWFEESGDVRPREASLRQRVEGFGLVSPRLWLRLKSIGMGFMDRAGVGVGGLKGA